MTASVFSCCSFLQFVPGSGFGVGVWSSHGCRPQQCVGSSHQQASAPLGGRKSHLDRQNQTCTSGMNRLTSALFVHSHRNGGAPTLSFSNFPKWTGRQMWSNLGTSPYMQFPVLPVQAPLSFKHCLFIPCERQGEKKKLILKTHTENRGLPGEIAE